MSVLSVRLFTDKVLHQPMELVTNFNSEELFKLSQDMVETMFSYKGIGLAAPQVGVNKNLAIFHLENKSRILVIANITNVCYNKEVGTDIQLEGCLSCPGVSIPIKRYLEVEIDAQNLMGEKVSYKFTDYDARILQHEYQHTQGILITQGLMKL
jgi:peptide deformylase